MATRRTKHKGRPKTYVKNRPHVTDKAARKAKKEKKRAKNAMRRAEIRHPAEISHEPL